MVTATASAHATATQPSLRPAVRTIGEVGGRVLSGVEPMIGVLAGVRHKSHRNTEVPVVLLQILSQRHSLRQILLTDLVVSRRSHICLLDLRDQIGSALVDALQVVKPHEAPRKIIRYREFLHSSRTSFRSVATPPGSGGCYGRNVSL